MPIHPHPVRTKLIKIKQTLDAKVAFDSSQRRFVQAILLDCHYQGRF